MKRGFTLIELLIVVAIIAILAAIAVPNFLEAQVRAKTSRVKADLRTSATAMESYAVDHNHYPPILSSDVAGYNASVSLIPLTTPIAYLMSLDAILDPFFPESRIPGGVPGLDRGFPFTYMNYEQYAVWAAHIPDEMPKFKAWLLTSYGPDQMYGSGMHSSGSAYVNMVDLAWDAAVHPDLIRSSPHLDAVYDASNGTSSAGDIARIGGQIDAFAQQYTMGK